MSGGEQTSVIVEAIINGHLDMAAYLLDHGADPSPANIDGLTALYAALDMKWRHNTWYPQPTVDEEKTSYLALMERLIDKGADLNARVRRKLWFRKFRYGDDWVEPIGATTFWRAAQANDVAAMRLLVARGADPQIPTLLGVTPLMVAAGIGFEYQGTNLVPDARLAAVRYLVDELHLDVNARDIQHYTALHGAAYVGENDLVSYLVAEGRRPDGPRQGPARRDAGRGRRRRGHAATPWPTWRTARARNRCCTPTRSSCSSRWARSIRTTAGRPRA